MASPPLPLLHVDLSDTIGALQIGSIFAVFMFGIVTVQCHHYYTTFTKDQWWNKALVALVWVLEGGQTACVSFEVYRVTIILYGRPETLFKFPSLQAVTILGGLITFFIQCFYSARIYRLLAKPYNLVGVFCIVAGVVRLAATAYLTHQGVKEPTIFSYREHWQWLISALLAGGAGIDVIIALAMLYYLLNQRSKGFGRTAKLLDKLIGFTIRTGLFTSVAAVTVLITFQTMPDNFIWLAFYTFLGKMYSNSLLSSLNARQVMRDELSRNTTSGRQGSDYFHSAGISVEVKSTREYMSDDNVIMLADKSNGSMSNPSVYMR